MPVRRRIAKRRFNEDDELDAWGTMFETGYDFFHDLEQFGICGHKAATRAAGPAWRRLGARFMVTWRPNVNVQTPWAILTFGPP